jgi:hypothetical protein
MSLKALTLHDRSLDFLKLAIGLLSMLVIILSATRSFAGSPIGELQYRFRCDMDGRSPEIVYEFRRDPITVGIRIERRGQPVIIVNEREAFEQSEEVVTFEYLSACEQARIVAREELDNDVLEDIDRVRDMLFHSDCRAIAIMQNAGTHRGSLGYSSIVETFEYERAKMDYMGVLFIDRVMNIRERCPF